MRWVVRILAGVLTLAVLAFGVVALIPAERVAQAAAVEFERITGRALTIEGDVRPSVWPELGVRTGPVTVANADWSGAGPMFRAEGLAIGLDTTALFGGEVRITGLLLDRPAMLLERHPDGRTNWADLGGAAGGAEGGAEPGATRPFALEAGTIRGGSLRILDPAAGRDVTLTGIDAALRLPGPTGPAEIEGSALLGGAPLSVRIGIEGFGDLVAGRVVPVEALLRAGGAQLALSGRAGMSPAVAEGRIEADLSDLDALAALAGARAPALPEGLGRRDLRLAGQVTLAPEGSVHLREGALTLDGNALSVEADLTFPDPRPRLSARIAARSLMIRGLEGGGGGGTASAADPGWSTAAIDVSALGLIDAEAAFSAESLDLGVAQLGKTRARLVLDRARAVIETEGIAAYGGAVAGQFVVNGRSGLSVGGDLTFAGLAMEPLLRDLAGWDRLMAPGDLRVKFLGVGQSMAAIMASLSGEGRMTLGRGEIRGLDLVGMLRTLDPGFVGEGQRTIFDSVGASFVIEGGVLRSEDFALAAPLLTATGAGTVGLGARVIDWRLVPRLLAQADGTGGVSVPLLITGPWSAPGFRLDLQSLADQKLAEEKARLQAEAEARARAELEKRAAELGVTPQEGESLEDAARRRAQEALDAEAQRALRRLLGAPAEAPAPAPAPVPEAPLPEAPVAEPPPP